MQTAIPTDTASKSLSDRLRENGAILGAFIALLALPFIVALLDNQSFSDMMANETGNAPFVQGLLLEIFVLAIYAISYDLIRKCDQFVPSGGDGISSGLELFLGVPDLTLGVEAVPNAGNNIAIRASHGAHIPPALIVVIKR